MGDIPIIWFGAFSIYSKFDRENEYYTKEYTGLEPEEMKKKFFDLCTDMGLDIEGNIIPEGKNVYGGAFWNT